MAEGYKTQHFEEYTLSDMTKEQFLVIAYETATNMKWVVRYKSSNGLIAYTDNGILSGKYEIRIKIENETAKIQSTSLETELMDLGNNEKIINKFISRFEEIGPTFTDEELDAKYRELNKQFESQEVDIVFLKPATKLEKLKGFFSIFKPTQNFFITPILIDLNILIFILMAISGVNIFSPDIDSLLNWGANFRPMTLDSEWWRLITSCFLHIGIFHLLMNMYAFLYIGVLLEPILGRTVFIFAYLLSGITASISSLWWNDFIVSAGASGAIFGIYGVFLALLSTNLVEKSDRKALLTSISVFIGYNLLNGLKAGIDNAAHIGGLLGGLVIGFALVPTLKKHCDNKLKYGTMAILTTIILVSSYIVYQNTPNDFGIYNYKIKEFVAMESKALEFYNLPPNTPREEILKSIMDSGIYNWKESIKLIDSFNELDLPPKIRKRNILLKEYCELRIKSYELLYKEISENTDEYKSEILDYNQQIEEIIHILVGKDKTH